MSIPIDNYVSIVSTTGGAAQAQERDTGFRGLVADSRIPAGVVLEFQNANAVGSWTGYSSDEYDFAKWYFSFVNKTGRMAKKMSLVNSDTDAVSPAYYGDSGQHDASGSYETTVNVDFTVGSDVLNAAIDLTGVTDNDGVATAIESTLQADLATPFTTATVTYNADIKRFIIQFAGPAVTTVSVVGADASGDTFLASIGLSGATASLGRAASTISEILDATENLSNDFFTFGFMDATTDVSVLALAADWALEKNNTFAFLAPFSLPQYQSTPSYKTAIDTMLEQGGNAITGSMWYEYLFPALICAATEYNDVGAAQNYMYMQSGELSQYAVTSEATYQTLKDLGVNFYGQTQQAGTKIAFYQHGVMSGVAGTDLKAMGPFMNEIWLKDAITVALINVQLNNPIITANASGIQRVESAILGQVQRALVNGTITIDKPLNDSQIGFITSVTNSPQAWQNVQNDGFWLDIEINLVDGQYEADYTLIYAKGDSVNKINGRNIAV